MPRIARIVIPGCPHHVTQRGHHRRRVFLADAARDIYFNLQRKYYVLFHIDSVGYFLMSNYVHHVLIPVLPTSPAKGIGRLHTTSLGGSRSSGI